MTTRPDDAIRAALRASGVGGAGRAVFLSGQGNGWRRRRGTGEAARGFVFRQAGPSLPTRTEEGEGRRRAPPSLARPSSSGRFPPKEKERGENPDGPNPITDGDGD